MVPHPRRRCRAAVGGVRYRLPAGFVRDGRDRDRPRQPGVSCAPREEERGVLKHAPVKGSDKVKVSFVLPDDRVSGKVSVVGDFNGWNPTTHPLRKRANGTRSVSVSLTRGQRYAFRYVTEEGAWHDDETAAEFQPNEFGGVNGVVAT
jgi:hypothetical protein